MAYLKGIFNLIISQNTDQHRALSNKVYHILSSTLRQLLVYRHVCVTVTFRYQRVLRREKGVLSFRSVEKFDAIFIVNSQTPCVQCHLLPNYLLLLVHQDETLLIPLVHQDITTNPTSALGQNSTNNTSALEYNSTNTTSALGDNSFNTTSALGQNSTNTYSALGQNSANTNSALEYTSTKTQVR